MHAQNVYNHPVDDLYLAISLGMEIFGLGELVSSIDQRLAQNVLRNLLSWYDMIDYGITKCTHTRSNKSLVVAFAVILFLWATIMAIFDNILTTM